jgi:hypothetical protein
LNVIDKDDAYKRTRRSMSTPGGFNCVHPLGSVESMRVELAQYNADETKSDYSHNLSCKETFSCNKFFIFIKQFAF